MTSSIRKFVSHRLPIYIYFLVGVVLLVQGVRYLVAAKFMPYHSAVIATSWDSLSPSHQTLFLGLLKGFGAGSLCVDLAIILLALMPLRAGSMWARWAIPAIAATYTAVLVYVTTFALLPGATPITVTITLFIFVIVATVCSCLGDSSAG